jgi:hypothetical protein
VSELDDNVKDIKGWLEKQGYPLEMMTARTLSSQGIGFLQGAHYEDPDTQDIREIDILSTSYAKSDNVLLLQAIIECKYSSQPLVAFTYGGKRTGTPLDYWVPSNPLGRLTLKRLKNEKRSDELPIFRSQNNIAYALKQSNPKDNRDVAYDAIMSVVKASYALSKIFTEKVKTFAFPEGTEERPCVYIGIPAIIVRAPLFICYLDEKDKIALEPRDSVLLEWNYPRAEVEVMMIRVIREKVTVNLGKEIVKSIELFNTNMKEYI